MVLVGMAGGLALGGGHELLAAHRALVGDQAKVPDFRGIFFENYESLKSLDYEEIFDNFLPLDFLEIKRTNDSP